MNNLVLTLKKQWFEMILSGEKLQEYREIKPYWITRLKDLNGFKTFDLVVFKNGYSKDVPTIHIEFKNIEIGIGLNKWGAPNFNVFIINLGKIVKIENIKT